MKCFVIVREESPGQFTAWPAGIPELKVTARTHNEAVIEALNLMNEWGRTGKLVAIEVNDVYAVPNPRLGIDPADPLQIEFMEDLRRMKQEDLERTLAEYQAECSPSSSIQTI
jgi:hypothetical protein